MTTIRVAHAGADYEVIIGDLAEALPTLERLDKGARLPIISDRRVFGLHGSRLDGLPAAQPILVPEGEAAKDWPTLVDVIDQLAALDIRRGTPIVAFGGGSVGDVAGLAASLFKRGSPIIHIPTTLLAQADSAIGGKTAIDAGGQKNLVGTFHHPRLVLADPILLETLDSRQMRSGYAEVAKYGLIDDPAFFRWCETNWKAVIDGGGDPRRVAIEHCVRAKARFVSADPEDLTGTRALLNFGHTFGHAIETVVGHGVLHGEAVAIGLVLAFAFSARQGLCSVDAAERVERHFEFSGLPTTFSQLGVTGPSVLAAMQADKKATSDGLTLILARGIGEAFVAKAVDIADLADFLERA